MRSHFRMSSGAAMACAVAGTATLLNGHCAAQTVVAADYATNSIYAGGWSAGQNGGNGFGAWSFDSTDNTPPGQYQAMTSSSALGTAWTLATYSTSSGLANVGRSIPGGLQFGQTFETIIQNPVNNAGIYTYRGFDILFYNGTTNNAAGNNAASLRIQVFDYFDAAMHWKINDANYTSQSYNTGVSAMTTGESGMIVDLTITSTNTYTLSMSPVSNPGSPYFTYSSTLQTNLPINYVNYRLWNGISSGPTDTADNFEIGSMTILGPQLPQLNIQPAGANVVVSWSTNAPSSFVLASSPTLNPGAVWNTNLPAPVVVGSQNVVTNPASGSQQFFRLQSGQ